MKNSFAEPFVTTETAVPQVMSLGSGSDLAEDDFEIGWCGV